MSKFSNPNADTARVIEKALTIDSAMLGGSKYIADNCMQYAGAINSWLELVSDVAPTGSYLLRQQLAIMLSSKGLIGTISHYTQMGHKFLTELEDFSSFQLVTGNLGSGTSFLRLVCSDCTDGSDAVRRICQVCFYLQRFTAITNVMGERSIDKFLAVNERCSSLLKPQYADKIRVTPSLNLGSHLKPIVRYTPSYSRWPSAYLIEQMKYEIRAILGKQPIKAEAWGGFSSGVTAEGYKTIPEKCFAYACWAPNFDGEIQHTTGVPMCTLKGYRANRWPRLQVVPKTLDSRRVIAPEPLLNAYKAQGALKALRTRLDKTGASQYINAVRAGISDVDLNRALALAGSFTQDWCTIDLSSASDSISRDIFFTVCPETHRAFFASYISDYVEVPRRGLVKLNTLYTSGNPLTWDTEAVYFLALARVSTRLSGVKEYRSKCYAYGDDIIIPSVAYECCVQLLEIFGHTVNEDKSYVHGIFRESCGGWYYGGKDITPCFWPRSEVTVSELQSLCKLQQHLLARGLVNAAQAITDIVKSLKPSMTFSPVGAQCDDLWSSSVTEGESELVPHWVVRAKRGKDPGNASFDHFVYWQYLKYGPLHDSALDELLHVSSSRRSAYTTIESEWVKQAPLYGRYDDKK